VTDITSAMQVHIFAGGILSDFEVFKEHGFSFNAGLDKAMGFQSGITISLQEHNLKL
jgi:hypothetical protein